MVVYRIAILGRLTRITVVFASRTNPSGIRLLCQHDSHIDWIGFDFSDSLGMADCDDEEKCKNEGSHFHDAL